MKAFLTREFFGIPVYAYAAGIAALALGYWYFKRHNFGEATAAPQVNPSPTSDNVYPYPTATTAPPVPPSPAFTTPGPGGLPWVQPTDGTGLHGGRLQTLSPQTNYQTPRPSPTPSQRAVYPQLVVTRTL